GRSAPRIERLGPDALTLHGDALHAASRRRKVAIKTLLLDQRVAAGVGNIYADEALFRAGIRPSRSASSLTKAQSTRLAEAVRGVLERAIETGGSSMSDYIHPDGTDGGYQNERLAYGRAGEPCGNCRTPLQRSVIGQRATCYCPRCQT